MTTPQHLPRSEGVGSSGAVLGRTLWDSSRAIPENPHVINFRQPLVVPVTAGLLQYLRHSALVFDVLADSSAPPAATAAAAVTAKPARRGSLTGKPVAVGVAPPSPEKTAAAQLSKVAGRAPASPASPAPVTSPSKTVMSAFPPIAGSPSKPADAPRCGARSLMRELQPEGQAKLMMGPPLGNPFPFFVAAVVAVAAIRTSACRTRCWPTLSFASWYVDAFSTTESPPLVLTELRGGQRAVSFCARSNRRATTQRCRSHNPAPTRQHCRREPFCSTTACSGALRSRCSAPRAPRWRGEVKERGNAAHQGNAAYRGNAAHRGNVAHWGKGLCERETDVRGWVAMADGRKSARLDTHPQGSPS